jgi:hypothetical protein
LLQTRDKPLLFVDVDGVISLFGGAADDRPPGTFHPIDGIPHFLSAGAAEHLLDLAAHFELVWCTGWEEKADEYLPHLLGLPRGIPHLSFERNPGRAHAHWKLAAIEGHAGTRPLAWIDDAFNDACHDWAAGRDAPTLLVTTEAHAGLTARERDQLRAWATSLRR